MVKKGWCSECRAFIVFFIFIFFSFTVCAPFVEKAYNVGDNVRLDFSDNVGEWCDVTVVSSSDSFSRKVNRWMVFKVDEAGNYTVIVESCSHAGEYHFNVVGPSKEDFVAVSDMPVGEHRMISSNITVGKPVVWRYRTKEHDLDLPESSRNIKYYKVQGKERKHLGRFRIMADKFSPSENLYEIEYETPAPVKEESVLSRGRKKVVVFSKKGLSYENVWAYTDLNDSLRMSDEGLISVYWEEEGVYLDFESYDDDDDKFIDRVGWIVPHLSNQTFIIEIESAYHLDSNREVIEDIYSEVSSKDGIFAFIPDEDYVRVTFEENLTREKDITLYAKSADSSPAKVEVYEVNSSEKIAEFKKILNEDFYKIFLTDMVSSSQDTFDLKVLGGVFIDLIIDPVTGGGTSGGLRPQSASCTANGASTACDGTYPGSCPSAGGSDYLSCDDANGETHETRKGGSMSVSARYFDSSISNCAYVESVSLCWEWSTDRATDSCSVSIDNDEDNSWSAVSSSCPPVNTCSDVTSSDGGFDCSDFFGSTGTRAEARVVATSNSNAPSTVDLDQLWYNVSYVESGTLDVNLTNPFVVSINNRTLGELFYVNASVECSGNSGAVCGDVNATLRYNSTSVPDSAVGTSTSGTPFYADRANFTCSDLVAGGSVCDVAWVVNSTEIGNYLLDVRFESNWSMISVNDTLDSEIRVLNAPWLGLEVYPDNDPGISENESFEVDCTVSCNEQACSDVVVNLSYCNTSVDCSPDKALDTSSYGLYSDVDSVSLGQLGVGENQNATFNVTGEVTGDYVLSCEAVSSNTESNTSLPDDLSLHVNDFPVAVFSYPSENEWLSGVEELNASSSYDSDGTISSYSFEIDDNDLFSSPSVLCDSSSETCSFDSLSQTECSQETSVCYLRLNVTDDDGVDSSEILQVGIDNNASVSVLGLPSKNSFIVSESQLVNATSTDSGSGVDCTVFEAYYDSAWHEVSVDCLSPYEFSWDLSLIDDQEGIIVRVKSNDSEGNVGEYDTHYNITHDTVPPVAIIDSPEDSEIINESVYLLNASSSYDETSGVVNTSWYLYNESHPDGHYIGSDSDPSEGWVYSWDLSGVSDGVYNISLNVTDNASLVDGSYVEEIVVDLENDDPSCVVVYPNGGENVSGLIYVNSSVSESDPSDFVQNVSFFYSSDGGLNWDLIGVNQSSGLDNYSFLWDTSSDSDSVSYLLRCNVSDSRGGTGSDVSDDSFTVDNSAPVFNDPNINDTLILINNHICLNHSVQDNIVGVESVLAEVDVPGSGLINHSMYDDGSGCDSVPGDGVYSREIELVYDGEYNWTRSYAYDFQGNLNSTIVSLPWSVYSNSYLISELLQPTAFFEINESGVNNDFNVECNISCNKSGGDCDNVNITIEYLDVFWKSATTTSELFYNEEDAYDCSNLLSGESCVHTFNLSSLEGSGGSDYNLRCRGSSSNAASDLSGDESFHVNDHPQPGFYYPLIGEWLSQTELLNASDSYDVDGSIEYYSFEIDDNSLFESASVLCEGVSDSCSFDTLSQNECSQETSSCYLRLNTTDDDYLLNSTIINVGIDNVAPESTLYHPLNNTNITTENQFVNATSTDSGSGVDCMIFEAYYDSAWHEINVDCSSPYEFSWDLSLIDDQDEMKVRVSSNDSEGNLGAYDVHTDITHDTKGPYVELLSPEDSLLVNNTDVYFNFSARDKFSEVMNCSLVLDGSVSKVNSSVLNDTQTSFYVSSLSEGSHLWNVSCVDSYGHLNTSSTYSFDVDSVSPLVYLNSPSQGYWSSESLIDFNFSATDDNLESCNLYGNWSGGWHLNQTVDEVVSGETNIVFLSLPEGSYLWNVECNDSHKNRAFNSSNYTINVDSVSPLIEYNPSTVLDGELTAKEHILINVSANDSNLEEVILEWDGSNESFDLNQGEIYYENKTGLSEGVYSFRAYANDSAGNINSTLERSVTVDLSSPTYEDVSQEISGVGSSVWHRGEVLKMSVNLSDNYLLSRSWISTNESGSWQNLTGVYNSSQVLEGSNDYAFFNWTNNSVELGSVVGWRAYVNDSVGRLNSTFVGSFQVWGYSEISDASLFPSGVKEGEASSMYCKVSDNVTSEAVSGHTVSFYHDNGTLIGSDVTDSSGYASRDIVLNQAGTYLIKCNISDDSSLYYNASVDNEASRQLGVGYGLNSYGYFDGGGSRAYEGTNLDVITDYNSPIDDPYTDLETDDNTSYQTFRAGEGLYAYTRFEFHLEESPQEIISLNFTWSGYGDIGPETGDGYVISLYNVTSGSWVTQASYSTDNTDQIEVFSYPELVLEDFINSSGHVKVLARSFSAAPTTGAGGNRWAEINNDYMLLDVYSDIIAPDVILNSPVDSANISSMVSFGCNVSDDHFVNNVSLYGDWNGGWHINETNLSVREDADYFFEKNVTPDGTYLWNCFACDRAGNCEYAENNYTFNKDTTSPKVNLLYPGNNSNFSGSVIPSFNFSASDNFEMDNCSLYGDWNNGWHLNDTIHSVENDSVDSYASKNVTVDNYYEWNVECVDYAGNVGRNSTNHTFSAFLPASEVTEVNITQGATDGTGDVTLSWEVASHSDGYKVYSTDSLDSSFSFLAKVDDTNYTDSSANLSRRRFYKVSNVNPLGENVSLDVYAKTVYYLKRVDGANTRNLVSFYLDSNLSYANQTLLDATNATAVSEWNGSLQRKRTCNSFSCPDYPLCTQTNCNFEIDSDYGYEIYINSTAPSWVNWSYVGRMTEPSTILMHHNASRYGRNWIGMYANTTLIDANSLISSVPSTDAVTDWDEDLQTSKGYIVSPFPWSDYIGNNFDINIEDGYEVSVTSEGSWTQE